MRTASGLDCGRGKKPHLPPFFAVFALALLLCWPGPASAGAMGSAPWATAQATRDKPAAEALASPASTAEDLPRLGVAAHTAAAVQGPDAAASRPGDVQAASGLEAPSASGLEPSPGNERADVAETSPDVPAKPDEALSGSAAFQIAAAPENPSASFPAKAEEGKAPIRLFGTVEFRGVLKNMPKWERVVAAENKSRTFDKDLSAYMRGSLFKQWLQLVERVENGTVMDKAKAVTAFFNRWPYRTDQEVYRLPDYWATPAEFLVKSGDCEDFAIAKFYALLKLGVAPEDMRIVALRDTIRNLAHAVLVVYIENNAYVLDNLTDMVLPHERFQHYNPQYSVNETYRWAHVMPKKKK